MTSIGENAFYDCENLKSITIPSTVTEIGKNAFDVSKEHFIMSGEKDKTILVI